MFPSKFPVLCILAIIGIIASVIATVIITGNALALFGLLLLQVFIPPLIQNPDSDDADAGSGSTIGFNADID